MQGDAGTCSDEETFDLDQQDIERRYKKLQTVYHPDRFANASEVIKVHMPISCFQVLHEGCAPNAFINEWCQIYMKQYTNHEYHIQEEKAFSEEASSLVNIAYSTLKSPLDRAIYLVRSAALPRSLVQGTWAGLCHRSMGRLQSRLHRERLHAAGEERHWHR